MGEEQMTMTDETLESIAAALYSGPPEDFISARNARAKAADATLSPQVSMLRKPSIAAWVVNVFAVERAEQLGEALQLAAQLREAQDDLDAATLSTLGRQRRALTRQLAQDAAALAKARGERVTPTTLEAVQQTISAAFFDPDAAAAVASGRLIRELAPSAAIDLGAVVAGGTPEVRVAAPGSADEVGARRRRRDAERAVRAAERARDQAESAHAKAVQANADAHRRARELAARIDELESELATTRTAAERAAADERATTTRKSASNDELEAAAQSLADAQESLDHLD